MTGISKNLQKSCYKAKFESKLSELSKPFKHNNQVIIIGDIKALSSKFPIFSSSTAWVSNQICSDVGHFHLHRA